MRELKDTELAELALMKMSHDALKDATRWRDAKKEKPTPNMSIIMYYCGTYFCGWYDDVDTFVAEDFNGEIHEGVCVDKWSYLIEV